MSSKIYDEISTVTEYKWDSQQDPSANIIGLCKSTDTLDDKAYASFSKPAATWLDEVAVAMEAGKTPPEFPDYIENAAPEEPQPDPAPRRRRRAPNETPPAESTQAAADTPTEGTGTPKAKKVAKRRSRKKASAKTAEATTTTEASEPGSTSPARTLQRGDKMSMMRALSLENPELTNSQFFELLTAAGLDPSESASVLVHYNTRHTLTHLKQLGYYDHEAALSARAAAESAAESDSSS